MGFRLNFTVSQHSVTYENFRVTGDFIFYFYFILLLIFNAFLDHNRKPKYCVKSERINYYRTTDIS
jgi:hypothetical protein